MSHMSSTTQSEVKAWEEEITACEHTLCLEQMEGGGLIGLSGGVGTYIFNTVFSFEVLFETA